MQTFGTSGDIFNTNVTTENKIVKSGRTRAMGIVLNTTAASGTVKFKYKTSGVTSGGSPIVINFPGPILFETDLCVAFTTEHVTVCSVFYN